jgi:hypothetical protein
MRKLLTKTQLEKWLSTAQWVDSQEEFDPDGPMSHIEGLRIYEKDGKKYGVQYSNGYPDMARNETDWSVIKDRYDQPKEVISETISYETYSYI